MNARHRTEGGFSLVELMVSMFLGLLILLGLITVFSNSSQMGRTQEGLSRIQENGRFAIERIKRDLELAGRVHCASVAMPSSFTINWNQGYNLSTWLVNDGVTFTNGFPNRDDVLLDSNDDDQLGDLPVGPGQRFMLDPRFFIQGHECGSADCDPQLGDATPGADLLIAMPNVGSAHGNRAAMTDVLTVRYLSGGHAITEVVGNQITTATPLDVSGSGAVLVADCERAIVDTATYSGNSVTTANGMSAIKPASDAAVYLLGSDLHNITYFVGIQDDALEPGTATGGRKVSSLFRSENGAVQEMVQGVERLDFFYMVQLQTGRVARLTADQVHNFSGGGDLDRDGRVDGNLGCIRPPTTPLYPGVSVSNDDGCLWRSVFAIEVHLLLNTVEDASMADNEVYVYSPDGLSPQNPQGGLVSGLDGERMYRREFKAVVPIRSYTL